METIILIVWIAFWVVYYILQGRHDVAFIKETEIYAKEVQPSDYQRIERLVIKQELNWKFWDGLEKLFVKLVLSLFVFHITQDLMLSALLFVLSIFVRWLVHDLTVVTGLGRGINHIGPDYIFTDRILRKLHETGINQYVIKLVLIVFWIALLLVHIRGH